MTNNVITSSEKFYMIDTQTFKAQFTQLTKKSAKSFNDQKALIKRLLLGKPAKCSECGQPLKLAEVATTSAQTVEISCNKGCTDIQLDLSE